MIMIMTMIMTMIMSQGYLHKKLILIIP